MVVRWEIIIQVRYLFNEVGVIEIAKSKINEEKLADLVIEADGEDYAEKEDVFEIYTEATKLHQVASFIEKKIEIGSAQLQLIAQAKSKIEDTNSANKILNLLEALEDDDDVQIVYTNFELSADVIKQLNQ